MKGTIAKGFAPTADPICFEHCIWTLPEKEKDWRVAWFKTKAERDAAFEKMLAAGYMVFAP